MFSFLKHIKVFFITFLVLLALLSFSSYASATSNTNTPPSGDVFEGIFCNIYKVTKSIGKPLLLIIIVFIAGLAYFGKVQMVAIVMIIIGAAVFFGAPTVVKLVTGSNSDICLKDYVVS